MVKHGFWPWFVKKHHGLIMVRFWLGYSTQLAWRDICDKERNSNPCDTRWSFYLMLHAQCKTVNSTCNKLTIINWDNLIRWMIMSARDDQAAWYQCTLWESGMVTSPMNDEWMLWWQVRLALTSLHKSLRQTTLHRPTSQQSQTQMWHTALALNSVL